MKGPVFYGYLTLWSFNVDGRIDLVFLRVLSDIFLLSEKGGSILRGRLVSSSV